MTEFNNTFPKETRPSHMVDVEFLLLKAPVCLRAVHRTIKMSGCQNYDVTYSAKPGIKLAPSKYLLIVG